MLVSKVALLILCANCRQNEGDTRASESTKVDIDEDLNDGSNNGATTLESHIRQVATTLTHV